MTVCVCLLLLALLAWRLTGYGFHLSHSSEASDLVGDTRLLDSFSQPSVGLAVLRQAAEQSFLAFHEHHAEVQASHLAALLDSPAPGAEAGSASVNSSPETSNRATRPEISALKRLAKLQAEVHALDIDLDCKLLGVYCRSDSRKEFLDCYLRTLQQAPERPWMPYRWYAVESAQNCGRAEELADALRHVLQFQSHSYGAGTRIAMLEMKAALEEGEAHRSSGPEVGKR